MPELTIPDISIVCRPNTAIPFRKRPGFLVCDTLGDLVNLGMGDSQGISLQSLNPTISDDWLASGAEAGQWKIPNNVCFYRFLKDGVFREGASAKTSDPNSDLFGIAIRGRLAYLDSKISGTSLDGGFTDLNWEEVQGDWESVKPPGAPQFLHIRPVGSSPTHKARTVGNLPANRSQYGEVNFVAQGASSNQAASRYIWGGDGEGSLSLCWRHGQRITVERKVGGKWRVLRALDGMEPANMRGGRYTFYIRRIAGRLCITLNGHNFHFILIDTPVSGRAKPIDYFWPEGKLQFNCFNVRGTLGVGVVKYSNAADVVYEGLFGRVVYKNVDVRSDETGANIPEVKFKGWQRGGTSVEGTATISAHAIDYDVTMTASAQGIDTPFVSCVMVRFAPEWTNPSAAGVDLRPALNNMRVTLPSIPSSPYAECTINLDRTTLDNEVPGWENYAVRYFPIEIKAKRKYDDGTYLDSDWVYLFKGYIYKLDKQSDGVNSHTMTLTCRDSSIRLQKPAAVIDHRYPPLDILFAYADASDPLSLAMYGYDGVREILRRAVGDNDANNLTTYFSDHYPLLDFYGDSGGFINVQSALSGQPPTSGSWFFPAPYGDDAMTWIMKLADYDKAVFYYGWPTGDHSDWPVPIYGRIPQIIASMNSVTIPDAVYLDGDKNKLLLQVSTETRPDRDINRVLVWSNPGGQTAPDFIPALRMASDQLEMPDINAPERTWERTMVIREDIGQVEGGAEAIATGVTLLLGNSVMRWPNFLTRGNPSLQWGTTVEFKLISDTSDETIFLDGATFRCERVEHIFDLAMTSSDVWTTSVQARPTSRGIF